MKRAIKVLIQTPDGWYFRGDKKDMGFTKARSKARVFDYDADRGRLIQAEHTPEMQQPVAKP